MSIDASEQTTVFGIARPSVFSSIIAWFRRPEPFSLETILVAAETGRLHAHLTDHYTIYYDKGWQNKLQLCRDLAEEGFLKAEFDEHNGVPEFINVDARITVAGREYLARLRQNHRTRRLRAWVVVFFSCVLSTSALKIIESFIESYAK